MPINSPASSAPRLLPKPPNAAAAKPFSSSPAPNDVEAKRIGEAK
jgi:hypothetical protein